MHLEAKNSMILALVLLVSWSFSVSVQAQRGGGDPRDEFVLDDPGTAEEEETESLPGGVGPVGGPGDVIVDETLPPVFPTTCGFGEDLGGFVTADYPGFPGASAPYDVVAVALARHGKIVVVGTEDENFALTLYHPDGSLDSSFGIQGKVITDFNGKSDRAHDVIVQRDGKILVVGSTLIDRSATFDDWNFALARYLPDGSLDGSFGEDGLVTVDFGDNDSEYGRAVAVQEDGKIVMVGRVLDDLFVIGITKINKFAIVRLHPDGQLDPSFDEDGKRSLGDDYNGVAVDVLADGRILASGENVFFRFNPDGSLDRSFDGDGKMTHRTEGTIVDLVSRDDGSYVALTTTHLAIYDAEGSLVDGRLLGFEGAALAIQNDSKIVVAGTAPDVGGGDFALARYDSSGGPDLSFGSDGYVTTGTIRNTPTADSATDLLIQPDDKILVAGNAEYEAREWYALARLLPDGKLDQCEPDSSTNVFGIFVDDKGSSEIADPFGETEPPLETLFLRGDANGDGNVQMADSIFIANFLFAIGPATTPPCRVAADVNNDDTLNLADVSFGTNFIFGIGNATAPPAPYPACGITRGEVLDCEVSVCADL